MSHTEEKSRIDEIASQSLYAAGVNTDTIQYCFEVFKRYVGPGRMLEMGPAEGVMTALLHKLGRPMSIVEGSSRFAADLQARYPDAEVTCSLFEDYEPKHSFDTIVLGHVLEHVDNPVDVLRRTLPWLSPGGRVLAAVPNARSIHRQAATLMGLLPFEEALNEMDRHHGHRRVYTPETFRRDFRDAGFAVEVFGGYWLKPLSNKQIEQTFTAPMLRAFMQLGEQYPDIAGEIYVVARRP
ncbi:MAG: class I SAM-dependent methyltransferase [Myxococcales bacterium]|nr:class I SAM-dependent methyltransferase [Myxococcales bacterium]